METLLLETPEALAEQIMEKLLGAEAIALLGERQYKNLRYETARTLEKWRMAAAKERFCHICHTCLSEK